MIPNDTPRQWGDKDNPMKKERSNHGFGLAVFSILLVVAAFLTILYFSNTLVASIIAFLSAIMATAGFFEARRADGPRMFALTVLIITLLGTFIILIWSGSLSRLSDTNDTTTIMHAPEAPEAPPADQAKKMKEMEKVIEQLEKDTTPSNPDSTK